MHAFSVVGGIPTGKVRYDNLRSAVRQVLGFSRARVENERWLTFRSHYPAWAPSTASPASRAHTRKMVSRARSGASAATTWSRSLL